MDLNRNQFMLIGVLLLLLGLQLRMVDTFVLTETSTRFLARQTQADRGTVLNFPVALAAQTPLPVQQRQIRPPRWLSFAFLSAGIVLSLHSLVMRKPGG